MKLLLITTLAFYLSLGALIAHTGKNAVKQANEQPMTHIVFLEGMTITLGGK